MKRTKNGLQTLALCALLLAGCSPSTPSAGGGAAGGGGDAPKFSLAWSEYPSWSVFGVAGSVGLIEGDAGKMGELEKKWNVDVVLNFADYDGCITQYVTSATDAVCITNMDILAPSVGRHSVAIMPTSTSVGADACIVVGINDLAGLKGQKTFGLEKSVSQYCFERVLELEGQKPAEFPFENKDPGVAASGMQSGQGEFKSIMVWNPFVLQTLRKRTDAKVLFDSSKIPEEIIDMVVMGKDSLDKPGGKRFAYCIAEAFYRVNKLIEDPASSDKTLVALGEKFGSSSLEDMKVIVEQTRFYKTPETGLALFEGDKFRKETMPAVAEFCVSHGISEKKPTFSFAAGDSQLTFTSEYLTGLRDGVDPATVK
ncbi:MAG: hypothetical protein IT423_09430 [Pirellulaceae bacterium]|nr:hypothetical protein [Pirellulaceae bacterium]